MAVRPGQMLGNYRVLTRIGAGGMGSVYLAEHPLIGKRVALKVIHSDLASNREVVHRFFNEARAVNTIGNEHVIEINDFGVTPTGEYFFVMEYIDGQTLSRILRNERLLHHQRALHIAAQIASALSAAHACGIIHRDLKPDNVMLMTRMGDPEFVKVLDFGLAKMLAESNASNLTAQGVVIGTPHYMSPEVCESRKSIDHRVDIYSVGILLFQMTTGMLPFEGTSMGAVLVKQVTELPPAPRGINPDIPPSVEQIILRCLAKAPQGRFAHMDELRQALLDPDRYLAASPPVMPSVSPAVDKRVSAPQVAAPPAPVANPNQPAAPLNHTMTIDTPMGHRGYQQQPAKWPLALILLAVAVVSGVLVIAFVDLDAPGAGGGPSPPGMPGSAPDTASVKPAAGTGPAATPPAIPKSPETGPDTASAAPATAPGPAATPSATPAPQTKPAPETVTVRLKTRPAGARVFDTEGTLLGKTPFALSLRKDGAEHVLIFRHPRTKERRKVVVATGDTEIELELELIGNGPRRRPR